MSYDLYFRFRPGARHASAREILAYFKVRPRYECLETQAWYGNETTGVYFSFEVGEREIERETDEEVSTADPDDAPVSFNINYCRPHFFGLEAEPELKAFVRNFDLLVADPQVGGMGDGEYSSEGFLKGWNAGNITGYRVADAATGDKPPHLLPTAALEAIWRWNYTRESRAAALGEDVYVPRIFHFEVDGKIGTGIVWGDACSILIPRVDRVLAPRKLLAPRKRFRAVEDKVLCTWDEIEPLLTAFPEVDDWLPARKLDYFRVPREIETFFRSRRPLADPPEGLKIVAMDSVLNMEIFERVRMSSP